MFKAWVCIAALLSSHAHGLRADERPQPESSTASATAIQPPAEWYGTELWQMGNVMLGIFLAGAYVYSKSTPIHEPHGARVITAPVVHDEQESDSTPVQKALAPTSRLLAAEINHQNQTPSRVRSPCETLDMKQRH
eukprot:c35148_g1_i1.p1 GENE.c35148_g1_i1~~c35148_g1_i1.p1  ORF type:complete len:136 (+),score=19.85 c35148_g1_i1:29-436(+)